jgi:hypothetical protein
MQAIQHILDLAKASSVESIEAETRAAHEAVENLRVGVGASAPPLLV